MPTHYSIDSCCRQTGRALIADLVARYRAKADQLEAFSSMLPEKLTDEQDKTLWDIAQEIKRP